MEGGRLETGVWGERGALNLQEEGRDRQEGWAGDGWGRERAFNLKKEGRYRTLGGGG